MPARRLPAYDYASPGGYFVTICTNRRSLLFATPREAAIVENCWNEIPSHFQVITDAFVVMPNHVHGILFLEARAGHARPLHTVVGSFKAAVSREINDLRQRPGSPVWQRGYLERVVRSERELEALRRYVADNPDRWNEGREYPSRALGHPSAPWL